MNKPVSPPANNFGEQSADVSLHPASPGRLPKPDKEAAPTLFRLIRERRSIRRYTCEGMAAHNRQPARIVLLDEFASKDRLAKAMGERLRADRRQDGDDEARIEQDVARSHARITGAAIVIILCLDMTPMDRYSDARRQEAEHLMAVQGVAMSAQNLLLMAHAHGLGACWMCAPLFCPRTVRSVIGLPAHWEPQALITMGWPANQGKPPSRLPLEEIVWRAPTDRSS
jgi:F420 biosynthesis protein FbiB-like protein